MTEFSKRIIYLVQKHHRGNESEMARNLGMDHNTLISKWTEGNTDWSKKYTPLICDKYKVSELWLRGLEPLDDNKSEQNKKEHFDNKKSENEVKKEPVKEKAGISEKDYWILYGKYEQLQSEVFWQRELITDGLVQYREQARNKPQPSSQEQAAGQVSQSADSGGNVVAKEPLSDETKKAIAEGMKKRNELIIDPGGQKE